MKIQPNTSWHLVLAAMVLHEHANEPVDLCKVIKMAAVHDIVELDAGDTFVYDDVGSADQEARERATAVRIFTMLPAEQAEELHALWCESEAKATPEARFASAPVLIVAGLLVGIGTRLGSGCTSGHGVCGVSRLSARSIVATLTFMAAGIATVAAMNALGMEVLR